MKKIYTKSVFFYNKKTKKYELDHSESEFHFVADDAPIAEMKGGGKAPSQTTVTNTDPWGPQQPYLTEGFKRAAQEFLFNDNYPGMSPETKNAYDAMYKRGAAGSPLVGEAQGEAGKTLAGDYLYGGEGFNAALDAAKNKIIPQVESRFAGGGRLNSGLAKTAEAGAIGDAFASMYGSERDRMQKAMAAAPGLAQADYADIEAMGKAGEGKDAYNESVRNERRNRIIQYLQAISGNYGQSGTATTTGSKTGGNSPWMGALGGGIAGFQASGGNPWGAALGGGLGLLSSWL